ncbi:DNA-directed DNA polymerase [Senna tora]|uniref:DNA-directed DNA polymerase n=1 Tax=Senna tora TaxID=362788 RepID=A0A834XCS2_9FABA|nr:DNA-directed DNA polymerase [Senna tora]
MPRGKKKKRVVEISPPLVRGRKTRGHAISHSPIRSLTAQSSPESIHSEEAKMAEQNNRNVLDYATPKLDGLQHSIRRPSIQANNFEIKPATIQLLQANGTSIDAAASGALMSKPVDVVYTLLETMSSNNHQWHSDRHVHGRVAGAQDSDMFASLSSQIVVLTKEVNSLADHSIAYPRGVIEDVLVKVDKFIFPTDFIVLDYEEDREVPIILGTPFLATGRTIIDVQKGELKMRVQEEEVTFNVFKAMKLPGEPEECFRVNVIESSIDSTVREGKRSLRSKDQMHRGENAELKKKMKLIKSF